MAENDDFNTTIMNEFRANGGHVGGNFEGAPMLLLHTTGAKSGTERVNPVMYQPVADGYAVFASKGGAPTNPNWYYNLAANPETTVEVGTATVSVTAHEVTGNDRDTIWTKQKADYPGFADYEASTDRTIPVMILTRKH